MFRQIKVHPDDCSYQRILWLNEKSEVITFQLTTVTYGLACAPFLALRVVLQLIQDEGHRFPLAINVLKKGRYVDDVFGGANSEEQAKEIVQQVNDLCMAGGLPLKKWISNNPCILQSIPQEKQLFPSSVPIDRESTVHALGMTWNPTSDTFHFIWTGSSDTKVTKRTILSTIARLFDPLGLIAPIIIKAKIFLQELWAVKLGWDDPLSSQLAERWVSFLQQLQQLHLISIPRWLRLDSKTGLEIHGFCDASRQAIAAAVYIRVVNSAGSAQITLLCSKNKVAPLKRLTIPRLELSAAVLLSKLTKCVIEVLDTPQVPVHLWSDSSIVFTWINSHPSRWKEFVHNRVCFIHESLPLAKWHFIAGKENPADCATRGLSPTQLSQHNIWWSGPEWLKFCESTWPNKFATVSKDDKLEERPLEINTVTVVRSTEIWDLIHKYSNLNRLLRITALCRRFVLRLQRQGESLSKTPLTTRELDDAKLFWVRITQRTAFKKEIHLLSKGESLPANHPLSRLTPTVDSKELLRLGGRLQASSLPFDVKHPLILPKDAPFTHLVISNAHHHTFHGGAQATSSYLRNEFWILGGRVPIRSYINKCVRCARLKQKSATQLMGQLPSQRVTPSRPFLHSGVDYAGPVTLKTWRGRAARSYKAYIGLFVCQSTSAIHLELVTDYTTDAFIAAYKRFTSRRGICATLRSDCGTNFKGADTELQSLFTSVCNKAVNIAGLLAADGTQWIFNPPASPHFGGKWEAAVKSVKYHLRRVIGDHVLTYEEMNTFLCQIEAVLNSRPLCPLTDDPDDLTVLTPGHFIIGAPLTIVPEPSLEVINVHHLSRWQ